MPEQALSLPHCSCASEGTRSAVCVAVALGAHLCLMHSEGDTAPQEGALDADCAHSWLSVPAV